MHRQVVESSEAIMARRYDMGLLREYLEEFENRLTLKLCVISAVAIGVFAALSKCMRSSPRRKLL